MLQGFANLVQLPEFWFGAVLLILQQVGRFGELNKLDPILEDVDVALPSLSVFDFAGKRLYFLALVGYTAISFVTYFLLCNLSPRIIQGWAQLTGQSRPDSSIAYPLYVAAILMGLAQFKIPGLSSLSDVQRNVFHSLIGVPKVVVQTSVSFFNQIVTRSSDVKALGVELQNILSDKWVESIQPFADVAFYTRALERLQLDDEKQVSELLEGSKRGIREALSRVIYAAALASVRQSGRSGQRKLARALNVSFPSGGQISGVMMACLIAGFGLVFFWCFLPILHGMSIGYFQSTWRDFWPADLRDSGQYIFGQAIPVLLSSMCFTVYISNIMSRTSKFDEVISVRSCAPIFVAITLLVMLFDFVQALFEFGVFDRTGQVASNISEYFLVFIPIYLIHSAVSTLLALILFLKLQSVSSSRLRGLKYGIVAVVAVALVSGFYAVTRLFYQYNSNIAWDFVVIIISCTLIATLLSLMTANLIISPITRSLARSTTVAAY